MTRRGHLVATAKPVVAVLIAFAISGAVFQLCGFSAASVFSGAWQGAVSAPGALTATIRWTIPLLLVSLGVVVSFRSGFFNVGGQGQMYVGAVGTLAVALALTSAPAWLAVPLAMVAGVACGAIWSLLPGLLRVMLGANEIVTTLMMNFVGGCVLSYVAVGPFKSAAGGGQAATTQSVASSFRLSGDAGVSPSLLVIAIAAVVLVWILVNRTRAGFEGTMAGRNPVMALWQGVDLRRTGIAAFAISGALAGLSGAVELLGPSGNLEVGFSPDVGLEAVIVALVASVSVGGSLLAALLFGGLEAATIYLPIVSNLPTSAIELLNGVIAFTVTARRMPLALPRPHWPRAVTGRLRSSHHQLESSR